MEEYVTETEEMASENEEDNANASNEKLTLKARKVKSSGNWKLSYANRSFKKEFLDLFPWVEEDPEDPKFAKCSACNKRMKALKGILETHQKTKTHLKFLSGCDDIEDDEEPVKQKRPVPKVNIPLPQPHLEQAFTDDQMSIFMETPMDPAHHALTKLIDKLVEKYHVDRLENLNIQNKLMMELHAERAGMLRAEKQRKYERSVQQEMYKQQELDLRLRFMQQQHELRITAMEEERDAKMKAVEQQLIFARKEYEKKVKLLDHELAFIK